MKKWLGISLASMMAIGMAGCSNGNTNNTANSTVAPNNASPAPTSLAKQALTIWDWTDPYADQYKKPMDIVLAKYKQENPNVELNIEKITNDDIRTKLLAAASADNLPDVAYIDGQSLAEFQKSGLITPLDEFVQKWGQKNDFPKAVWDSVVFDGKTYGIPGDGDVRTLLYRKDAFEKAGLDPNKPPKTWSELIDDAQKLTAAKDKTGIPYGLGLNGGNSEHTSMNSLQYIWDLGGDFVTADGKPALNSEPVVKTLQFMTDLVQKNKVAPPDSYLRMKKEVAQAVIGNETAMAIVGSWEWRSDASFLKAANLKDNVLSAPIPLADGAKVTQPYTAVGYGTWVIFNKSKVKDAAWKWIEQVTSPEHEVNIFKDGTGNMPMRVSAYKDPIFSSDPIFKTFIDVVPNARPRPKTASYEVLSQTYRTAVQEALSGKKSPQQALDDAQKAAQSKIDK
ncbi:multiple sugar transport system substrate-binding protein [Paenibacillus sp. yr247]|uniref:ABC transporter substrate-binding protein n=1 Tax=Paenibacillus sp. yr247 TaxID=1761880 RepID=UPI0008901311|nr:ABC transporter substrate-binding protein [Paenibacillus sp. yr247]SDO38655.1 multiple sugar transport system substrate-binding protein [Paenibacillus sp. yr247]